MLNNDGISVSDALALRNNNGGFGSFGGDGAWWIILFIIIFGGGNFFGGNNNNACCTPATAQGVTDAFNFSALEGDIRSAYDGINGLNNSLISMHGDTMLGFANNINSNQQLGATLGLQLQQGFCDVGKGFLEQNYINQAGFNAITNQLDRDACDVLRGQQDLQYAIETANNKTIIAIDALGDRMINYWNQNEMERLRGELAEARFQNSQQQQTTNIINTLMPTARPAYITCNPFAASYGNGNNGCGCGY